MELKWFNILVISSYHLYFVYACFTFKFLENLKTLAWLLVTFQLSVIGVTGGPHRLWSHRAYKAKWPLKIILIILNASAGMSDIFEWVRDHRIHHKYTDTIADPYGTHRGFFFSHIGWVMMKKHPEVIRRGREVDMSDILADRLVMFSVKYHKILTIIFVIVLPVLVPVYGWNETWYRAFASQVIRYILVIHSILSINSVAHTWGSKPYDVHIYPTNNRWVSIFGCGEGWHNYHHVFPWDYRANDSIYFLDSTTKFINFMARIKWAYDLKQPSEELIRKTAIKQGDGSFLWNAVPYPESKIISK